jgi:hypothetical protein
VSEPIKLYLDEDTMSRALVRSLRARGFDVLTAGEAGRIHTPDREHLEYATLQNRTIFTFNVRDFAQLHAEYLSTGRHHTGIIVSDQLQVGAILRRLLELLANRSADDMKDWLEYLSNWHRNPSP